jgi:hypothetical protein
MPRVTRRRSQKAGSCSFVSQDKNRKVRKGSRKSQRAGGCAFSAEPRRAGAKRSMRGGGSCSSGRPHAHDNKTRRLKRSRKGRSSNRKRAIVMCDDGSNSCRRR